MPDVTAVIKADQQDAERTYDSDADLTEGEIVKGLSKLAADALANLAAQESDIYK
jgi:hypothetical protein